MDIQKCAEVKFKTNNIKWSNVINGNIVVSNQSKAKTSQWNILPMSDKFEYSKKLFIQNNN